MCLAPGKEVRWRTSVRYIKSPKKYQENCKKCLTNGAPGGNICKLSDERPVRGREGAETAKNLEKKRKKLLTKRGGRGKLNEFTATGWNDSVPCKLNNEKTN